MKKINVFLSILLLIVIQSNAQNVGSIANDPDFFPIAVWVQNYKNAEAYKAHGINMFVGIWGGMNQEKLDAFKKAGIKVICGQDEFSLQNINDPTIYAWMHGDEPDNAQFNRETKTYDPCVDPQKVIDKYHELKSKDPSRPVYLNLGQGVAYINYIGRGTCRGNIDTYKVSKNGYLKGCDIASFDIYPVNNWDSETSGNLWYVANGIDNLKEWSDYSKPVWCWIETTKIHDKSPRKPTPAEVKSEVWMALIHGANGYGFFCHSFTKDPPSNEAAFLHDKEMISAMKEVNFQVQSLARVLNSPTTKGFATVESSNNGVPIDIMTKNQGKENYIFAVAMRPGSTSATFKIKEGKKVEVIGENRTIKVKNGKFSDDFLDYAVHLYKVKE
jgi:hypothetical protein